MDGNDIPIKNIDVVISERSDRGPKNIVGTWHECAYGVIWLMSNVWVVCQQLVLK